MTDRSDPAQPLTNHIALVAGATRGAGRGIARALGEAGATVYCTGRSQPGQPSDYARVETIDETATLVTAAGGTGIALRVDHTNEDEVKNLVAQIEQEQGRLDLLVDSVAGDPPGLGTWAKFWELDLAAGSEQLEATLLSRLLTAKHATQLMLNGSRGLIVEVTEGDLPAGAGNNALQSLAKAGIKHLVFKMAEDLAEHPITAVALTPGFLRSEAVLDLLHVSENNWQSAGEKDPNFLESESPLFVGRAVVALTQDPKIMSRSGDILSSWELAREFQFTDYDGRVPDWGKLGEKIISQYDFVATALRNQTTYLERMTRKANRYLGKN